ncbi:gasdermin-A-like [Gracilinanus agilis]|uniref:gasdermin-A-like n=1 Tax=Gracilinanus agilis TaxID=191870 RepID=UPI001CFE9024|nr:gasdermin-A-like [Gracilinanus agilis]
MSYCYGGNTGLTNLWFKDACPVNCVPKLLVQCSRTIRLEGFLALQGEVKDNICNLKNLILEHCASLLEALLALLGQAKALQELEDKMNRALDLEEPVTPGSLGGPGDTILAKLQDTSGKLNRFWAGSILYLLGALQELIEEQQQLLAMSVEKKILSQQLKLMETILDQNFLRAEAGPLSLHSELLQNLQGEELTVTKALIGLCGLDLQEDGHLFGWQPDALPPLCALYAALSVFQILSIVMENLSERQVVSPGTHGEGKGSNPAPSSSGSLVTNSGKLCWGHGGHADTKGYVCPLCPVGVLHGL